jgi:hypothetical protein
MVKKIKVCFNWAWDRAGEIFPHWRDGLRTAIEIIGKDYEVDWVLAKEPEDKYDFILVWSDQSAPVLQRQYSCPMGLCYGSTFPPNVSKLRNLKVVYAENTITLELLRRDGLRAIKAFGTDTDFFSPADDIAKDIPYFYPATFSPWKRQGGISFLGNQLTCAGEVQPDGENEYQTCVHAGVNVIGKYTPSIEIRDLYRRSQHVMIPALYGSERTVLEAMSNDILPSVMHDNDRAMTYINEYNASGLKSPREFVKMFYSAEKYAEQILKGILE